MPVLLENEMTEGEIAAANVYGGGRWLVGRSANDNGWQVTALKQFNKGELVHCALKLNKKCTK